jgi:predicted GNAT family acetyltransferase
MQIQLEQTDTKGTLFIEENGKRLAEMVFSKAGNNSIIIEHTEVSDALRGTGAGKKLVLEGVDYARKNHLTIVPLCPFAKSVFDRTPELQDVLKK